ncbi:dystroglycan-like [Dorcoceras hygrometricum]|uniref:Dystroglycan-like n=1 Tax=Dorcoceras hygrometricum TaxID=472368 RepID=A0A2Z7CHY5_9LAMI|nr:dystroglycan-like [Dorcoceras hygrometricum]
MASAYYSNTVHIDFASVLAMENPGIVSVLNALMASGLEGFLGCPTVIYESELVDFFNNGSVRDGLVVSTVNGVPVEISEQLFAETFELPVDGLADLSEMPKHKIFDARSIVSLSGDPVNLSGRKGQMKIEYRLLCDIMEKAISIKAGVSETAQSASTEGEQIEELDIRGSAVAGHSTVTINERQWFDLPYEDLIARWDAEKEVTTPSDTDEEIEAGRASEPVDRVQTEVSQPESLVEKSADMEKSTADQSVDEFIDADEARSLEDIILSIPVDVPLPSAGVEITKILFGKEIKIPGVDEKACYLATLPQIPVDEKGKEILVEKDHVKGNPAKENFSLICADIDMIVNLRAQVIDDVDQFFNSFSFKKLATMNLERISAKGEEVLIWEETENIHVALARKKYILLKYRAILVSSLICLEEFDLRRSPSEPVDRVQTEVSQPDYLVEKSADMEKSTADQSVDEFIDADEARSLEDIIMSIPADVLLPSVGVEITEIIFGKEIKIPGVDEKACYLATLPQIPVDEKGKEILVEKDHVKGNPAKENFSLICADIDMIVNLRAQVIDDVDQFFNSFSFKKLATMNLERISAKGEEVLIWEETENIHVALARKKYILLKYRAILVSSLICLEELTKEARAHGLSWKKTCCSKIFEGSPHDRGAVIARSNTNTRSSCWIRTMILVNGTWVIESCADKLLSVFSWLPSVDITDFLSSIALERTALRHVQRSFASSVASHIQLLDKQSASSSSSDEPMHFDKDDIPLIDTADIQTSLPVGRTEFVEAIDDLRTLLFSGVAAHGLNVIENFVDVKKELSAQDAKITALDGQIAAIRSEQLEFQAKITADLLSLSTQLGDIVDYIRGGDAKKGEGSSSHRPLPSPVNQGESSGNVVRTTMISQRVIDNAQRYIVERMMTADRERERSRGSRSGSYKRRRF